MRNKKNKILIPAIAAVVLAGGGYSFANAANTQVKHSSEVAVENDDLSQAELAKQAKITEEAATKIALEKVPGTIDEVELEDEDGTIVYEFEIVSEDGTEQEVKVDANTGKIVKVEADDEDGEEQGQEEDDELSQAELAKQAKITEKAATKIALEKVPGTIDEVELEDEDGTIVYEFEIVSADGTEQEVKVDAKTGKIVKVEADEENDEEQDD
ncbi:PepSY domain-containing protein [Sporosarcina sp. Sa2YVA2]|uniref:PepSY domain-containing protein n=1 Tax=Sporosarcina quadrami TaxID=2762234 RepID=A0ABR8UCH3_9BACL|nr:PepSY domain-containing protein [Sporosarcina quadrami]MBD7985721.1 PepSY domain-containing protein [Sporosarcina quadrami]